MSQEPIDMILHCPLCGTQHIDEAEPDICECEHLFHQDHEYGYCTGKKELELGTVIDCPCDQFKANWMNPPHRSHLCHSCGTVWRPADVPTNGVQSIKTRGKCDTWSPKVEEKDLVFAP